LKRAETVADLQIRPYNESDEPAVLELLKASLGAGPAGDRSPEFFRWKHIDNPFGSSYMLLGEVDGVLAGLRAFMRWEFLAGDDRLRGVRAVDTATHPEFQGRGIFAGLTKEALIELPHEADFVFNTPNEKSLSGYLKWGWKVVAKIPIRIRVKRPLQFVARIQSRKDASEKGGLPVKAVRATEVLADDGQVSELLRASQSLDRRLSTDRSVSYLRWRYANAPLLDYRAVSREEGGQLKGIGIFRVRPRGRLSEATISELIVRHGDRKTARILLKQILRSSPVDHAACHFPSGTDVSAAAGAAGFLRAPGGMTFVVNPLREALRPNPVDFQSWALSIGDVEVF
jgi:GNAT superfamily N-acetyltransferase